VNSWTHEDERQKMTIDKAERAQRPQYPRKMNTFVDTTSPSDDKRILLIEKDCYKETLTRNTSSQPIQ
jgi:hypothetical protein